jgi:NAD(P)-dependent dehydrogenase (short-subunit alcohol dehydrogenase family)
MRDEQAGGRAIAVGGDVADEGEMSAAFDATEAAFRGIDVVVNTAGIMILAPVATFDLADLDRIHRTNMTLLVGHREVLRPHPSPDGTATGGAVWCEGQWLTRLRSDHEVIEVEPPGVTGPVENTDRVGARHEVHRDRRVPPGVPAPGER